MADDLAGSPHLAFPLSLSTPLTYTVWVRGMAPDAGGDSLHVGLDADTNSAQALTGFAPGEWSWANTTLSNTQPILNLSASSAYTLDLWLREDELRLDRVLLITDTTYIPSGVGPVESPRDIIGGGGSLDTHVITYGYDDLYRLTAANVSGALTASYGYGYDVLGNRMIYIATLTNTAVTTYTYDAANRLETAKADNSGVVWRYVHDNNGNRLQQLPGSLTPTEGAVQYTYDQRGQLVQVATHDGSSFQLQAEMVYDGAGNRLQAIAHANGSAITATYTLDPRSGLPLLVDNGTNVTMILYGQTAIGEYAVQTAEWRYYLGDAQLSVRQLVDGSGTVTQAQTYSPYGVLLHQDGDGGVSSYTL